MSDYRLKNERLEITVMSVGATVTSIKFDGKEQSLRYDSVDGYLNGKAFIGASIGRYGNRIGNSAFTLNGKEYLLAPNEGANVLHGGPNSYDKREWRAEADDEKIRMSIFSPDGDNGFPGNLTMTVTFSLRDNALRIDFEGETDSPTVFAPTFHPYFIAGPNPEISINSDGVLENDEHLIPTGNILSCSGDWDFHSMRRVPDTVDNCFVIRDEHALTLRCNGTQIDMYTDFPAVQVYSGGSLESPFRKNEGIAIEPEFYPDAPNHPDFPSTVLNPGDKFKRYVEYRFS